MNQKLLTTREVSLILQIPEKEVIELAGAGIIPHVKLAGEFLRFKKEEVLGIKETIKKKYNIPEKKTRHFEQIREFFYFYDFYIIIVLLSLALLWVIFAGKA